MEQMKCTLKQKSNKVIALLLSVVMILTMLPTFMLPASAEQAILSQNATFNVIAYETSVRVSVPLRIGGGDVSQWRVYMSTSSTLDKNTANLVLDTSTYTSYFYLVDKQKDVSNMQVELLAGTTYYFHYIENYSPWVTATVSATTEAAGTDSWTSSGHYDTSWYNETDTTFNISSSEQLAGLAVLNNGLNNMTAVDFTGKTIKLTASVDVSKYLWSPIGTKDKSFNGTFDGGNYNGTTLLGNNIITGMHINTTSDYVGLFGFATTGDIKNTIVANGVIYGGQFVGGIAGSVSGNISNCYSTSSVNGTGNYVGGVVGYLDGSIENSNNTGIIRGDGDNIGGISGKILGTTVNCYNTGEVNGNNNVGGVIGQAQGTITNCYNTGSVRSNTAYVGGITGQSTSTIDNCYNKGSISSNSSTGFAFAGGIVGSATGVIIDCYNISTVSGIGNYVGGVAGKSISVIENCYNTSVITGSGQYVGGVVGTIAGSLEDSYNTGSVSGTDDYVGGISGVAQGTTTNCSNTGSVKGKNNVGGIVGQAQNAISNCYSIGVVTGSVSYVGGIAGQTSATIDNCYNTGSISGSSFVSGVAGNDATIKTSYSTSNVNSVLISKLYKANGSTVSTISVENLIDSNSNNAFVASPTKYATDGVFSASNLVNKGYPVLKTFGYTGVDTSIDTQLPKDTDGTTYLIKNAYQLDLLRDYLISGNAWRSFKLAGNIDISPAQYNKTMTNNKWSDADSWKPIGTSYGYNFSGSFDGNGYTVSGIYINSTASCQGLFGYKLTNPVKNLGVNGYIKGSTSVGGIIGYNYDSMIENCYNACSVYGTGASIGGIVGDTNTTIKSCYNAGTLNGGTSIGGVVGKQSGSTDGCYNSGTVSGITLVGGVAGQTSGITTYCSGSGMVSGGASTGGVAGSATNIVTNCFNTGKVTGYGINVGGVAGLADGAITNCYNSGIIYNSVNTTGGVTGKNNNAAITNCYNAGTVSGGGVGGISGNLTAATITNCYNTGMLKGDYVAGVVGTAEYRVYIESCYNQGMVLGTEYIGGIVGRAVNYDSGSIKNCYNKGVVYGTKYVGGVAGATNDYMENCSNQGPVSGTTGVVGGVVGDASNAIQNCSNQGTVSGTYGIGGVAGNTNSTITNCSNTATVTGSTFYTGGVVGITTAAITNCYNLGRIGGTSSYVGGVAGGASGSTIISCYNKGLINSTGAFMGGIAGESSSITKYCYNIASISANKDSNNQSRVGGITGDSRSNIAYCYNTGNISGTGSYVGGIAGGTENEIKNTYSIGSVTGSSLVGEIVGWSRGSLSYNYYSEYGYGNGLGATSSSSTAPFVKIKENPLRINCYTTMSEESSYNINHSSRWNQSLGADFAIAYSDTYTVADTNIATYAKEAGDGSKRLSAKTIEGTTAVTSTFVITQNELDMTGTADSPKGFIGEPKQTIVNVSLPLNVVKSGGGGIQLKQTPTITLAANPTPSQTRPGTVTLTANIAQTSATGTVTFMEGTNTIGTVNLSAGTATTTFKPITAKNDYIFTAIYNGDANYNTVTSSGLNYNFIKGTQSAVSFSNKTTINKIYGEANFNLPSVSGGTGNGTFSYRSNDESVVTVNGSGQIMITGVGTATVFVKRLGDNDYNDSSEDSVIINVSKATPIVTLVDSLTGNTYNGSSFSVGNAVVTGIINKAAPTGAISYVYFTDSNCTIKTTPTNSGSIADGQSPIFAGSYFVKATYAGDEYYNAATSAKANLVIGKRVLTATITPNNKSYNGTTSATISNITYNGKIGTDDVSINSGTIAFSDKNVGTSIGVTASGYVLSGNKSSNYTLGIVSAVNADITAKTLTVSVDHVSISYGEKIPALHVSVIGFVSGENESNLTGFIKPTATHNYVGSTLRLVTDEPLAVTYIGGEATKNYVFEYNDTTTLTILGVDVNAGDYHVDGYYTTSENPTPWNSRNLTITPINGYDQISADGTTWVSSLTVEDEATNGSVSFMLKKSSGIQTKNEIIYYNLDKTNPTGTITIKGNEFKSFLNTITFGLFFKNTIDGSIKGEDTLSGVKSIEYQIVAGESTYDEDGIWITKNTFSVSQNEKFVVYTRINDNAGNLHIINSDGVIVYTDSTLATSTVYFDSDPTKQDNADVQVAINLNNNTINEISNGAYTLVKDTDYTINGSTVTLKKAYLGTILNDPDVAGESAILTFSFHPLGEVYNGTGDEPATAQLTVKEMIHAQSPTFQVNLSGKATYARGDNAAAISVRASASDAGSISYQWYVSSSENITQGTVIADATAVSYTPKTDKTGMYYYYVVAANTNSTATGEKTVTSTSGTYVVIVNHLEVLAPKVTDDAPATTLKDEAKAVEDAVLNNDDQEKLAGGSDITIYLKVESTDAPEADKALVMTTLDGRKIGQYLDVSLIKIIDGNKTTIAKTNSPLTITIDIPMHMRSSDRTFAIIRVHDGVTVTLPDLDKNPETITIESDRFSTYAIVYSEPTSEPSKTDTASHISAGEKPETAPNTGDHFPTIYLALLGLSLSAILYTGKKLKHKAVSPK